MVKVELLGLWPEYFQLCPTATDAVQACNVEPRAGQLGDYPAQTQADGALLQDLYARLLQDFAGAVLPVSVSYASPRGLLLSLRFRLRQEPVAVVGGRAIALRDGYDKLKAAVAAAL